MRKLTAPLGGARPRPSREHRTHKTPAAVALERTTFQAEGQSLLQVTTQAYEAHGPDARVVDHEGHMWAPALTDDGRPLWSFQGPDGLVAVQGFDGTIHAYEVDGDQLRDLGPLP